MEWIKVEDRLPASDDRMKYSLYLAVHAGWDHNCRVLMFDNEDRTWTQNGDDTQKVTHWQELPEVPKAT